MAVASDATVYVSGRFEGEVDFDPGLLSVDKHTAAGERDIFVVALDEAGGFLWSRTSGQTQEDWATAIAVTDDSEVVLTGYYESEIGFDDGPTVHHDSEGFWDAYVLRLDTDGDRLWSISMGAFRGGPVFPAVFVGTVGGLLTAELTGLPTSAAIPAVVGASLVAILRLPLAAAVIALLLGAGAGVVATPLVIVAVVIGYLVVTALGDPAKDKASATTEHSQQPTGEVRRAQT